MPTDIIESIGDGKDYANISAWANAHNGEDLVSQDRRYIGEVYAGTHSNNVNHFFNQPGTGTVTDATRYRMLRPAAGEEYDPVADTGVKITNSSSGACFRLTETFFRLQGPMGLFMSQNTTNFIQCVRIDRNVVLDGLFGQVTSGNNDLNAVFRTGPGHSSGTTYITNCIAIGSNTGTTSGATYGFDSTRSTGEVNMLNCVAYETERLSNSLPSVPVGNGFRYGVEARLHNCIAIDSVGDDFTDDGTPIAASHNTSSDATAPGTSSQTFQNGAVFVRPNVNLFRPSQLGGSINSGFDATSLWFESPPLDFGNVPHGPDQWERGPFSVLAGAPPVSPRALGRSAQAQMLAGFAAEYVRQKGTAAIALARHSASAHYQRAKGTRE